MPLGDVLRSTALAAGQKTADASEDALYGFADIGDQIRYGVSGAEKSKLALTGQIPGSRTVTDDRSAKEEERRASGHLFGKQWPSIASPAVQYVVNPLRRFFGESDPALQQIALESARRGSAESLLRDIPLPGGGRGANANTNANANTAAMQADALRARPRFPFGAGY